MHLPESTECQTLIGGGICFENQRTAACIPSSLEFDNFKQMLQMRYFQMPFLVEGFGFFSCTHVSSSSLKPDE
jgi:hypothetical protein